jgi:hypothetical protein
MQWTLFTPKEGNYVVCSKMDATRDPYVKRNKSNSQSQTSHIFSHVGNFRRKKEEY